MDMKSPTHRPAAIVIGASSGIGEALARRLLTEGWQVGLAARRTERLEMFAQAFGDQAVTCLIDVLDTDEARVTLKALIYQLRHVELIVISAGTGHANPDMDWQLDKETISVNALGFAAVAQTAMKHFMDQGHGHLVGISSIAKLRANGGATAYCASKAFVSTYLDGLRDLARHHKLPVTVTEACPGFVDTDMLKADKPFWVATPARAADCIYSAIKARSKHVYVTKRWGLIGSLLRLLPSPG
ncbi:SDR family NAD(P)-dependent oxidoreductase [Pseudomonas asuensis]|uniref:Oxidoreductase n=1 Tax=Pseudomonas asuensis TaxID=1825787 RepID=A0ABQ2GYK9_9PSED|nr:SDR family NAD(P)-dependent oxidoreductase [Pseudomonas asuensis]GGM18329.1 oxidoreductase [Pseudomonas asuensis]